MIENVIEGLLPVVLQQGDLHGAERNCVGVRTTVTNCRTTVAAAPPEVNTQRTDVEHTPSLFSRLPSVRPPPAVFVNGLPLLGRR